MNSFLISNAIAQSSEAAESSSAKPEFSITSFLPIILIFGIFYFFVIRPQNKKMKETQLMLNSLKVGEKVVTSSGIVGVIRQIYEKEGQILLEIANNVEITILRNHIAEVERVEEKSKPALQNRKSKSSKK